MPLCVKIEAVTLSPSLECESAASLDLERRRPRRRRATCDRRDLERRCLLGDGDLSSLGNSDLSESWLLPRAWGAPAGESSPRGASLSAEAFAAGGGPSASAGGGRELAPPEAGRSTVAGRAELAAESFAPGAGSAGVAAEAGRGVPGRAELAAEAFASAAGGAGVAGALDLSPPEAGGGVAGRRERAPMAFASGARGAGVAGPLAPSPAELPWPRRWRCRCGSSSPVGASAAGMAEQCSQPSL